MASLFLLFGFATQSSIKSLLCPRFSPFLYSSLFQPPEFATWQALTTIACRCSVPWQPYYSPRSPCRSLAIICLGSNDDSLMWLHRQLLPQEKELNESGYSSFCPYSSLSFFSSRRSFRRMLYLFPQ